MEKSNSPYSINLANHPDDAMIRKTKKPRPKSNLSKSQKVSFSISSKDVRIPYQFLQKIRSQ